MTVYRILIPAVIFFTVFFSAQFIKAQNSYEFEWDQVRPSNTGIPGEEVRALAWTPEGNLWVGARWPFWAEGGIGKYDIQTGEWSAWSNFESPLPTPLINEIIFDNDGNAWISSDQGLVKYDGSDWTVFDPTNSPLDNYVVTSLDVAPDGKIWLNNSSSDSGGDAIWSFDGVDNWVDYRVPEDIPFEDPWTDLESLVISDDGKIYVSNTTVYGLAVFDGNSWELYGEEVDKFDKLAVDNSGNVWMIGNPVGGQDRVYKFDGSSFSSDYVDNPQTLAVDNESNGIYVGTWGGLVMRSMDNGENWQTFLTGLNNVFNIEARPGFDEIWVGTNGAVGRFDTNSNWIEDFNTYNTGHPDYFVDNGITKTPDGNLWFATGEAGLSRYDGEKWRNWGEHNAGSEEYPFEGNEPMFGVYQDSEGTVWMGGNGVARWEPETNVFTGFWNWENSPLSMTMKYFAEGPQGNFFAFGQNPAIYQFQGDNWEQTTQIQPYFGIYGVENDSEGNIWIAGWFDLHYWDGNSWTTEVETSDDTFGDVGGINCFAIEQNDTFWFGTAEGLMRWDGSEFVLFNTANSPLPANYVRGIDIREDGMIAVSAATQEGESGIALLQGSPENPDHWTVFESDETPIAHWQLEDVEFNSSGNLWISAISMGTTVLKISAGLPQMVYTVPEAGEQGVNPDINIQAIFNSSIIEVEENDITITPDPDNVNVDIENNNLIFSHNPLAYSTTYTVTILQGAISNENGMLEEDISWSFTTITPTGNQVHEKHILLHPNPAERFIRLSGIISANTSYKIHAMNGRLVSSGIISGKSTAIPINHLKPAIYTITLYLPEGKGKVMCFVKK